MPDLAKPLFRHGFGSPLILTNCGLFYPLLVVNLFITHQFMKFLAFIALIFTAPCVLADWEQFEETSHAVVYIDRDRIQKNAQFPTLWQLTDLKHANPRGILSNRVLLEFNCDEKSRRTIAFTSHKTHMAEGKPAYKSSQGGLWHPVQDDTVIAKMMALVCEP